MTIPQLKTAIENSEYFQTYPGFKQRTNLTVSDVKLIESVL